MPMTPPDDIIAAARAAEKKWGIPAAISIAQWALESGWGRHMPPGSNNPFGIKARPGEPSVIVPTREVIHGRSVIVEAPFRRFASIAEAFDRHGELLATAPAYARARAFEKAPDAFADALTGVYATDPHYGTLLHAIMRGANLYRYDAATAS
jgi:flagellum-specific peptidoglycan hydrolase FlgJ